MNIIQNTFRNEMKQEVMILLTYALLIFVLYSSITNIYFLSDDLLMINFGIIDKFQDILHYFTSTKGYLFYRPVLKITFWLGHLLFGLNPTGYHFMNLSFHFLNTVLVFYICDLLTKQKIVSGIAALIFAIHPLHSEVMANIALIGDQLWAFFFLLVVYFFIRYLSSKGAKRFIYFIASVLFFALSLFSKETAIIIPVLLLVYEFLHNYKNKWATKIRISTLKKYIPFLMIGVIYFILRQVILKAGTYRYNFDPFYFLTVGYKFVQLFIPFKHEDLTSGDWVHFILNLILFLNILILISISLIFSKKTLNSIKRMDYLLIFSILWIIIITWPLYFHSGDRMLYASLVGSSILFAILIVETFRNLSDHNRLVAKIFLISLTASIVICFSIRTFERIQLYKKVGSLSKSIIFQVKTKNPKLPSHSNLYLINFPTQSITDSEGWSKIPFPEPTMQAIYNDKSLKTYCRHKHRLLSMNDKIEFLEQYFFFKNIKENKTCYVFEYENGVILDKTNIFIKK